jgi:hypothetical protein
MVIHRIKAMWFEGSNEVLLTHCGSHGFIKEEQVGIVKAQTAYEFIHATMGNNAGVVDCPRCMMENML